MLPGERRASSLCDLQRMRASERATASLLLGAALSCSGCGGADFSKDPMVGFVKNKLRNHFERLGEIRKARRHVAIDPIQQAVERGDTAEVRRRLDDDPRLIDIRDPIGKTLIHTAVWWGRKETAELLLARGAKVEAKDDGG